MRQAQTDRKPGSCHYKWCAGKMSNLESVFVCVYVSYAYISRLSPTQRLLSKVALPGHILCVCSCVHTVEMLAGNRSGLVKLIEQTAWFSSEQHCKELKICSCVKCSLCFWVMNQSRSVALTDPNKHTHTQFSLH